MPTFADAGRVIEQNLEALRKPGILAVRPGYRTEAGWPVGDPVIVALVGAKKGEAAAYGLPSQVGGVPVEVREASPLERLKATQPSVQATLRERTRVEQHTPNFPFEHSFAAPPQAATTTAHRPTKPQIPYHPAEVALTPVTDTLTVICNASPDAGWPTLRDFFARTQQKLVVGLTTSRRHTSCRASRPRCQTAVAPAICRSCSTIRRAIRAPTKVTKRRSRTSATSSGLRCRLLGRRCGRAPKCMNGYSRRPTTSKSPCATAWSSGCRVATGTIPTSRRTLRSTIRTRR